MDVDLSDMRAGLLLRQRAQVAVRRRKRTACCTSTERASKIWASIFSAYPGRVGVSRTFEGFGQRDEAGDDGVRRSADVPDQDRARPRSSSARAGSRRQLMTGLKKIDGMKIWTSPDPSRSVAVLSFQPGSLDVRKLSLALYQKDQASGARPAAARTGRGSASRRISTTRLRKSTACLARSRATRARACRRIE